MAMGYLAWNVLVAYWDFNEELDEIEEIQGQRVIRRMLRDMSNPFECPESAFRSYFRVSRELALDLCGWVRPFIERERSHGLKVEHQVLAALRFFTTGSYQSAVGQDVNISLSQTSVSRAINVVARVISETLLQEFVKFPTTEDERRQAKEKFARCPQTFRNTLGAIDCTHIAIVAPREHEENYINHHGYHSINVQLVCDPTFRILQVNARYGGRTHDAFIWNASALREHLTQRYMNGQRNTWLLGDSGYPLEPWLLTPLPDADPGTPEFLYTEEHCKSRSIIERCNGIIKGCWGCLSKKRVLYYDPVTAEHIVYACAVLHNLRIHYNLLEEDEYFEEENVSEDDIEDNAGLVEDSEEEEDNAVLVEDSEEEVVEVGHGGVEEQHEDDGEDSENGVEHEEENVLVQARNIQNAYIRLYYT